MASFQCRCRHTGTAMHPTERIGSRMFCQQCQLPIHNRGLSHHLSCPVCDTNEAWQEHGSPCLACQLAAIVYRNPFQDRLNRQLQRWLTQDLSDNSKEANGNNRINHTDARHPTPMLHTDSDLMRRRNQTFQDSFQEMRSRATPEQTRIVFENLSMLQQDIQSSWSLSKRPRDDDRLHLPSTQTQDEDPHLLLPGRRNGTARQLSIDSAHTAPTHHTRHPLRQLDTNCSDINTVRSDQYKYKGTANTCATVPHTHARSQRAKKRAERCRLYKSRKNGSDNCGH
jgi:hypothetical protein